MKKNRISSTIEYLILLFYILLSKTVFWGIIHENETTIILSLLIILNLAYVGRFQINKANARIFGLLSILLIFNILIHYESLTENLVLFNFKRIVYLLISLVIVSIVGRDSYIRKYVIIILSICFISFLFLGLKIVFPDLILKISTKTYNPTYVYNPFYTFWRLIPYETRNYGPFWEPGGFQGFIIIALTFFLFNNELFKYKKAIFIFLVLSVLSTFSTTGYISLILIFAAGWREILHIMIKDNDYSVNRLFLFFVVIVLMVVLTKYMFSVKVISDKLFTNNRSVTERINDLKAGVKMILIHPIFGYGSYDLAKADILKYGGSLAFSNGVLSLGFTFGIPFLLLYAFFFKRGVDSIIKQGLGYILPCVFVYAMFAVQFFGEEVCVLPLYWGFMFQHKLNRQKFVK